MVRLPGCSQDLIQAYFHQTYKTEDVICHLRSVPLSHGDATFQ